jgi:hypothetical protein
MGSTDYLNVYSARMLSGIANVRVLFSDLTSFANEFNVSSAFGVRV